MDATRAADLLTVSISGRQWDEYARDEFFQAAVERCLEIVGEALRKAAALEPRLFEHISELRRIIGLRHRLAHGYDVIANDIIWDIATTRVPLLPRELESLLSDPT